MIFFHVIVGIIMLLALVIQGHASFDVIRIAEIKPDILFIIIIYLGYSFGSFYGEVTGFIGGLFHDAVSNSPLGLLAFPKMALGLIVGLIGRSVFKTNTITVLFLIFAASIVKGIVTLFLSYLFHQSSIDMVLHVILPEAFYNSILAPPLFFVFDKIFEHELEREVHF